MKEYIKEWDWNKNTDGFWYVPCEESHYLMNRWEEKRFEKFLDLGTGRGRHAIQFANGGFDVDAVDLSEVAVQGLNDWAERENLKISGVVGDMMHLPFASNSFDCLLAYHVISHTDTSGIKQVLSEVKRVLKEDGEFFITFCSKNAWSYKDAGFPKLDENTIIKIEDGAENNVPHFYVDSVSLKELMKDFELITVRHVQDVVLQGTDYVSWHYFVLGKNK